MRNRKSLGHQYRNRTFSPINIQFTQYGNEDLCVSFSYTKHYKCRWNCVVDPSIIVVRKFPFDLRQQSLVLDGSPKSGLYHPHSRYDWPLHRTFRRQLCSFPVERDFLDTIFISLVLNNGLVCCIESTTT